VAFTSVTPIANATNRSFAATFRALLSSEIRVISFFSLRVVVDSSFVPSSFGGRDEVIEYAGFGRVFAYVVQINVVVFVVTCGSVIRPRSPC
jgi:hypothetical protein